MKHSAQHQVLPRCAIMLAIIVIMSWILDAREWHLLYPAKDLFWEVVPKWKARDQNWGSWVAAQGRVVSGNGGEMPRPKAFWPLEQTRIKKVYLQALLQSCEPHFHSSKGTAAFL